jgi:hypothetical protein
MRIWPGKRHALSVRVALWEAACDALEFFRGAIPKISSYALAVHVLARAGGPGECLTVYIAEEESHIIKLNQFVRSLSRDGASARRILADIGGMDIWDQKKIVKEKADLFELAATIELHKNEGVSWDEIFEQQRKAASTKPK